MVRTFPTAPQPPLNAHQVSPMTHPMLPLCSTWSQHCSLVSAILIGPPQPKLWRVERECHTVTWGAPEKLFWVGLGPISCPVEGPRQRNLDPRCTMVSSTSPYGQNNQHHRAACWGRRKKAVLDLYGRNLPTVGPFSKFLVKCSCWDPNAPIDTAG